MSDIDFARFVDAQRWIFAKTMPHIPHWYCLRREAGDDAAVRHITVNCCPTARWCAAGEASGAPLPSASSARRTKKIAASAVVGGRLA